ncbi:hypothetical protein [uncultured Aquabacterium sp.]|jgi:hypothetical protein|uniref:hypothetical protein n=1 Tax=uncultured Aquabacterium sp. TaxID=158753 RepID=UPI0026216103|nr:hypothetical protein [uncultured Aquabacterium sp.]
MKDSVNVSDMPDVDELRGMARSAFETLRSNPPTLVLSKSTSTLLFVQNELRQLGHERIYQEESRRHELLKRGFTPPDDLSAPAILTCPSLTDAECDELRRSPGSFYDMVRAIYRAGWNAHARATDQA